MKPKIHLSNRAFWIVFIAGLAVAAGLYASLVLIPYGTETAAIRVTRNVEKRLKEMDRLILECSENDGEGAEDALENVPSDIVIYRYAGDSLQTWYNQFTEINDDISSKLIFSRITDSPNRLYSPLNKAGEEVSYINMGPKWYLVKAVGEEGGVRTIAGLEIKNSIVGRHFAGRNGVNPKLHLGGQYDIVPLSEESGTAVNVFGRPVFKITGDILGIRNEAIDHSLFSPLVYADGPVLSSLGALLLYNTLLTAVLLAVYLMRQKSVRSLRGSRHPRRNTLIYGIGILLLCAFSCAYIHITIKSLIYNSGLLMEFFRFNFNSNFGFSALTFLSYILLIIMTLFQLFSFKVVFTEFTGKNINTRSAVWPVVFACICALYLTVVSGVYGFRKEERRAWGWADRLAIERDLGMEMQLLTVEDAIAGDPVIGALIDRPHNERPIRNRITEVLLGRMAESADIGVTLIGSGGRAGRQAFDEILATGTRISDNSRFFWCDSGEGRDGYCGLFAYRGKDGGINRLIVSIAGNRELDPYGYRRILPRTSGISGNGIPSFYSYAKYRDKRLKSFRGDYPYPTVTDHIAELQMGANGHDFFRYKGYNHFCSKVGNGDIVVISRPTRKFTSYFTSFSLIFLLTFTLVSLFRKDRKRRDEGRNLLRTKINLLVIISLTLTLAAISLISVIFVYDRNEMNMTRLMSAKINTVQALLEKRCQHLSSCSEMRDPAFYGSLSEYAQITRTDITIYTPSGKVYISTVPEIFESLAVSTVRPTAT